MAIEPKFSTRQLDSLMEAMPEILAEEIVRAFSYLGEECVKRVRDRPGTESWFDITGNLRSSIGYAVYEQGRTVIQSAFNAVENGADGASKGRDYVASLASKYAETYALVVVAGMEYADYVEAKSNKDVLASTDLWARGEIDRYLQKAIDRATVRIMKLQQNLGL